MSEAWRSHDPATCAHCRTPARGAQSAEHKAEAAIALERLRNILTDSNLRTSEKTAQCRGVLFDYDAQREALR